MKAWVGRLAWIVLGAISAAGFAGVIVLRCRFVVVTISGRSMLPSYASGDRVLARRVPLSAIRRGQVVVIEEPAGASGWPEPPFDGRVSERGWMIKRAIAVPGDRVPGDRVPLLAGRPETHVPMDRLVVLGDNPGGSFDSRIIGYIPGERLLGVVIRRFAAGRERWVDRGV